MDYALAMEIWGQIKATTLTDLKQDLIDAAVRYARLRVDWLLADPEKQASIGSDRAACHNALISTCDILGRNMARNGEDASWRETLGADRQRIGDFACFLHCRLAISAR
jgi:hypothetical protein